MPPQQVQPNKFRNKGKTSAGAGGIPADAADADEYWRCPPHTPVFTNVTEGARPEDGVPRVISHVPDGLDPTGWFRFVGVTMEDGIMDVAAQKTHKRCNGKGRFTVAAKGTVTVNCSVDNLREAQFAYGDPFCISLYRGSLPNGVETSAPDAGSIRSCAFGGRLESTRQRTFVYNKVGIRIGTFISTFSTAPRAASGTGPAGSAAKLTRRPAPAAAVRRAAGRTHWRGTCLGHGLFPRRCCRRPLLVPEPRRARCRRLQRLLLTPRQPPPHHRHRLPCCRPHHGLEREGIDHDNLRRRGGVGRRRLARLGPARAKGRVGLQLAARRERFLTQLAF